MSRILSLIEKGVKILGTCTSSKQLRLFNKVKKQKKKPTVTLTEADLLEEASKLIVIDGISEETRHLSSPEEAYRFNKKVQKWQLIFRLCSWGFATSFVACIVAIFGNLSIFSLILFTLTMILGFSAVFSKTIKLKELSENVLSGSKVKKLAEAWQPLRSELLTTRCVGFDTSGNEQRPVFFDLWLGVLKRSHKNSGSPLPIVWGVQGASFRSEVLQTRNNSLKTVFRLFVEYAQKVTAGGTVTSEELALMLKKITDLLDLFGISYSIPEFHNWSLKCSFPKRRVGDFSVTLSPKK